MQHSEFSPAIAQEVEKRWPSSGLERSHLLNFRCKVAQELFEGESDEVRRRMEEECIKSHREAVDAYNSAGSGEPSSDPAQQAEYVVLHAFFPPSICIYRSPF